MNKKAGMTYAGVGVDYEAMDPFKRMCQQAAVRTARHLERFGFRELEWTRGESVYLIETPWCYLAFVIEGLGTKNLVADNYREIIRRMSETTGISMVVSSFYDRIAQDTFAMIVNDMATLGVSPLVSGMHCAAGSSKWFDDEQRSRELSEGYRGANDIARCSWGVGETPVLKGITDPSTVELSGAAMGIVMPKERLIHSNIQDGDVIIFLGSSGIHANGLTMAREIAAKLPDGYWTKLFDGRSYGEALLTPTTIYSAFVEDCLDAGVPIHYAVNITGHGWRKLMRAREPFVYIIDVAPEPQPEFLLIQKIGEVSNEEMYGNFNMGAGFALFIPSSDNNWFHRVVDIAKHHNISAWWAGRVEKRGEEKKVIIKLKDIVFEAETLQVR